MSSVVLQLYLILHVYITIVTLKTSMGLRTRQDSSYVVDLVRVTAITRAQPRTLNFSTIPQTLLVLDRLV